MIRSIPRALGQSARTTPLPSGSRSHAAESSPLRAALAMLLGILLAAALCFAAGPAQAAPKPDPKGYTSPPLGDGSPAPKFAAESWIAGDLGSGRIFESHDPDRKLAPASVMKLLTALSLVDVLKDKNTKYTAVDADADVDGTKVGLMPGNKYTIDQLFHAMLMSSANDAAFALGNAAGGQDKALQLMADKAEELGLTGTVPKTVNGLDAPGQSMTTHDLFIIAHAVVDNPYLMKVVATKTYMFPGGKDPQTKKNVKPYEIQNHTKIVGDYRDGLGLKNGYTVAAKGSFVCAFKRDGKTYAAAILSSTPNPRQPCVDLVNWAYNQHNPPDAGTIDPGAEASAPATAGAGAAAPAGGGSAGHPRAAAGDAGSDQSILWWGGGGLAALVVIIGVVVGISARRRKRPTFSSHGHDTHILGER